MSTIKQTLKRNAYAAIALLLTAAVTIPNLLIGTANAAQITDRSIQMSDSATGASAEYTISFTVGSSAAVQGIVVDFCDAASSPLIGESCTLPTVMTIGTTVSSATVNGSADGTWSAAVVDGTALSLTNASSAIATAGDEVVLTVSGFTNTSTLGTFYARILTYGTTAEAGNYTSTGVGTPIDTGGIALSTANTIDVTARVMETLTFCVAAEAPQAGCGGSLTAPSLELGHGTPKALSADAVDTASAYFQLSTNATSGAVVRVKNSNASAGLESGTNVIAPVNDTTPIELLMGSGTFGMRAGNAEAVTGGSAASGTLAPSSYYGSMVANEYNMRTQAASTYGDELANTAGAPVNNYNMPLAFGASAAPTTAPGIYTATLSLIATGKY